MIKRRKIIVSVINDLSTDQRVHKVCEYLCNKGFEVVLVGRLLPESLPLDRDYETHRMKLLFRSGAIFYAEFQIRLLLFLLFRKANLLLSNDLDTLMPSFLISRLKDLPLIYDSHEYFLGVPEIQDKPFVKKVWRFIESRCVPKLSDLITVNDSIAHLYKHDYDKTFNVVRNIPRKKELPLSMSREELGLPEGMPIVLLQGAGINVDRGGEEAVQAMKYIEGVLLLIVGSGDVVPYLKEYVKTEGLTSKVRFIPRVPFEVLASYTQLATIGLSVDKLDNPNYLNSLPNKLFDYIHAGVPVMASKVKEIVKIMEQYDVGMLIENHDPKHMAEVMLMMIEKAKMGYWNDKLQIASNELTWQHECEVLDAVYLKYV